MSFRGKRIWITGASAGIGEALAYAFADAGANLVLSGRREAELRRVRDACSASESHVVVPFDLTDHQAITAAADAVLSDGHVDVLVNCGGMSQRSKTLETSLTVDRRLMEVNYFGTIALTKVVAPAMVERGSGHVVVISSVVGRFGGPQRSAYAASKHALHGFFDVLRSEVHDAGVKITLVCPGYVQTDISRNSLVADGSPWGEMDPNQAGGMPVEVCARKTLRAVARGKSEVYMGGREVLAVYVKRFFPGLLDRILRRMQNS